MNKEEAEEILESANLTPEQSKALSILKQTVFVSEFFGARLPDGTPVKHPHFDEQAICSELNQKYPHYVWQIRPHQTELFIGFHSCPYLCTLDKTRSNFHNILKAMRAYELKWGYEYLHPLSQDILSTEDVEYWLEACERKDQNAQTWPNNFRSIFMLALNTIKTLRSQIKDCQSN